MLTSPRLRRRRRRAVGLTFGTVGVALAAVLLIPAPLSTTAEGVVWLPEEARVRAGTDGFVRRLVAAAGSRVKQGDPLLELELPTLDARLTSLDWKVRELELSLARYQVSDPAQAELVRFQLDEARGNLAREREREKRLIVRSGADGTFTPAVAASDLPGRFLREGEAVGFVLPDTATTARVAIRQENVDLVRERLTGVELKLVDRLARTYDVKVVREVPAAQYELPSAALGRSGGGEFPVDPREPKGTRSLNRVFQVDVALPEAVADPGFGGRILVRFDHRWEPLGKQLYRRARQLLLSQFDA